MFSPTSPRVSHVGRTRADVPTGSQVGPVRYQVRSKMSRIFTSSAREIPTREVTVGFVRPCSMSTKCCGLSPAFSAAFSWLSCFPVRSTRMRSPKFLRTSTDSGSERASDRHFARDFFVNRGTNPSRPHLRTSHHRTSPCMMRAKAPRRSGP